MAVGLLAIRSVLHLASIQLASAIWLVPSEHVESLAVKVARFSCAGNYHHRVATAGNYVCTACQQPPPANHPPRLLASTVQSGTALCLDMDYMALPVQRQPTPYDPFLSHPAHRLQQPPHCLRRPTWQLRLER